MKHYGSNRVTNIRKLIISYHLYSAAGLLKYLLKKCVAPNSQIYNIGIPREQAKTGRFSASADARVIYSNSPLRSHSFSPLTPYLLFTIPYKFL